jgi:hypothetical protein
MRVLALVTACLVAASATISFLACSSDNPAATGGGNDGGGGSSGEGTSGSQGTSGNPAGTSRCTPSGVGETVTYPDGGPKRAPNGCILHGTGLRCGAKVETVANPDFTGPTVDWTNPEGAFDKDEKTATFTITDGQQTKKLRISDFGITFPSDKVETWGFIVELIRQTQTAGGVLQTANVNVEIPGKSTQFKYDNAEFYWPTKIMGTHAYGQETDTWQADINPPDFTPAAFAATLEVQKSPDGGTAGPVTGTVDSLRVEIWYATGDDATCEK